MPPKKYRLKVPEASRGQRLDQVLAEWLPVALAQPVSKAKARKLIVAGAVYLNGTRVRIASKEMRPGANLEAFIDPAKLFADETSADKPWKMNSSHILYEDADLIAVNKPAGLPTQPTLDEARANLFAAVKRFLKERDGGDPYVGLHHRLDRDTSGVVLFTKSAQVNAGVAALFSDRLAVKTYQAIAALPLVEVAVPREWTVKNYLGKAKSEGKAARFTAVKSGGDFAHTDFRILKEYPGALHVQARPRTGRTHQIRVHLAEGGMPILGDRTYGRAGAPRAPRLMLHAASLTFPHPLSKLEILIESPIPEDFRECLRNFSINS